jgi:uncharacterized protein YdiU (UPF0061 family)
MMHVGDEENSNVRSLEEYEEELRQIAETEFTEYFTEAYDEVKRRKLGLTKFRSVAKKAACTAEDGGEVEGGAVGSALGGTGDPTQAATTEEDEEVDEDELLWRDLEQLMAASDCDFTILFRELGKVAEAFALSADAGRTGAESAERRVCSGTDPKSSQHATMFVPSTPDVSLFPNIAFAVDQQQAAEGTSSAVQRDAAALVEGAMQTLAPAFYSPDKVAILMCSLCGDDRNCFNNSHVVCLCLRDRLVF